MSGSDHWAIKSECLWRGTQVLGFTSPLDDQYVEPRLTANESEGVDGMVSIQQTCNSGYLSGYEIIWV